MGIKNNIHQVFIKWVVGDKQMLLINLNKSGSISRAGDGHEENSNRFFMGRLEEDVFGEFMKGVKDEMFDMTGRYELPDPKGEISVLTISFEGVDVDTGFEFKYGTESDGPPEELVELVEHALIVTHPWWEDQLSKKRQRRK